MERFKQYANNAGVRGLFKAAVTLFAVVWSLIHYDKLGIKWYDLPVLVGTFALPYRFRDFIVENMDPVRVLMNGTLIAAILIFAFLGDQLDQHTPYWFSTFFFGAVGLYWGLYFWMISDPRVVVD